MELLIVARKRSPRCTAVSALLVLILGLTVYLATAFRLIYLMNSESTTRDLMIAEQTGRLRRHNNKVHESLPLESLNYKVIAKKIATKWNMTSPRAAFLLEQQFYKFNDYNSTTDFLHFHHIPKTGGTSISDLLNKTLSDFIRYSGNGEQRTAILPGSKRSGSFSESEFYQLIGGKSAESINPNIDLHYLASYGHTRLRPIHGPNRTKLSKFFQEYSAMVKSRHNKTIRLRSLGMLREPMDLRASNHAMAMCALNGKVYNHNFRRSKKGLGPICTPEEGLNISSLIDEYVSQSLKRCNIGGKGNHKPLDRKEKQVCNPENRGKDVLHYCRSPSHLLESSMYNYGMRSMMKGLMGRFYANQEIGSLNYISLENIMVEEEGKFVPELVEDYTLIDLGGLDPTIQYTKYDIQQFKSHMNHESWQERLVQSSSESPTDVHLAEPDFLWFGITERMKESSCLLFHTLRTKPVKEVPHERVVKCSPTSWWTGEHRREVRRREPADYAVWRTANAIFDVRVLRMIHDLKENLNGENTSRSAKEKILSAQHFLDAGCLNLTITF